jgi:hypothetical protein
MCAWGVVMSFVGPAPAEALPQIPTLLVFGSLYAYPAAVVLGVPAYLLYRRLHVVSLRSYALGGLGGGALLGAIVFGFADSSELMDPRLASVLLWLSVGIGGAVGAAFFWAFAIRPARRAV